MIKRLSLALALAAASGAAASAQQGAFWSGADRLKCTIDISSTCDGRSCTPLQVAPILFVELGASRICASRDGTACAFRYYPITQSDQSGRLLLVVQGTGTSYSIGADGRMAGSSVVSPVTYVFVGRCEVG